MAYLSLAKTVNFTEILIFFVRADEYVCVKF